MTIDQCVQQLKITDDFSCNNPSWFNCKSCDYFYSNGVPRCLKRDIKEWALYHIEQQGE